MPLALDADPPQPPQSVFGGFFGPGSPTGR